MRTVQSFSYDFYSGANVGLWIGGKFVTTALGIEFSLVQNKRPVYGYASQLWDGVSKGTVQCSGVIIVNFQEPQLLPTLIANIGGVRASDLTAARGTRLRNTSNEINEAPQLEENTVNPANATANDKANLREHFWGPGSSGYVTMDPVTITGTRPATVPVNTNPLSLLDRPDQHGYPFDVLITYGDAFGNERRQRNNLPIVSPSTTRTLKQVHLTGFGQTITVEGQPVLEQYPFICREVR